LGKAARLNQTDLKALVSNGDGINPNTVRNVLRVRCKASATRRSTGSR